MKTTIPALVTPARLFGHRPDKPAGGGGFQAILAQSARQTISTGQLRTTRSCPHCCAASPKRDARYRRREISADQRRGRRLGRRVAAAGRRFPLLPAPDRWCRGAGPRQPLFLRRQPLGQRRRSPRRRPGFLLPPRMCLTVNCGRHSIYSKSANATLRCFVYTPPDYEKDSSETLPGLVSATRRRGR